MSEPIGPGDWVECVKSSNTGLFTAQRLYLVKQAFEVDMCSECDGCPGLHFEGMPTPSQAGFAVLSAADDQWPSCCFRPIYRPREDLIQTLLQPLPADVEQVTA